jgi:hypothetical protein
MKKSAKSSEKLSTSGQSVSTASSTLTSEEESALQTLARHEHIWLLFNQTGEIVNLFPHVKQEIVDAYKVFDPHYHANFSCGACMAEMLKIVYNFYDTKK